MITLTREEAQQVLDALEEYVGVVVSVNDPNSWTTKVSDGGEPARKAIKTLRTRLEQPQPFQVLPHDFAKAVEQQVLAVLEWNLPVIEDFGDKEQLHKQHKAIEALRARLAQPEPVAVAWMMVNETHAAVGRLLCWQPQTDWHITWQAVPLYTAPPQREWHGLTDEDFVEYCKTLNPLWNTRISRTEAEAFFRAGAAKLREKNGNL